ncbi:MAG: patatin-like phospholipase family protein [Pseudomonadota bacterium]
MKSIPNPFLIRPARALLLLLLLCAVGAAGAATNNATKASPANAAANANANGTTAAAAVPVAPAPDPAYAPRLRPKVALVLSGGGARGFAHIGVLRVLQELRVPVDFVVGTSMGSVVGGAYAAGSSVEQLEQLVRRTDWVGVIADRPPRDQLAYRRREEDTMLPSRIEFSASMAGVSLPPAAAGNAALEMALGGVLPAGARDKPVNRLQLPFRSVASDLLTGSLVNLDDTPLFLTMRASLAVPGVFAPVRVKERLLVDGGLVRNLPIDVARAMGADVIIAVNVGTPLAPEKELGSAIGVAQQMLQILTEQNVQRSLKELGAKDVLIAPDLNGIGFLDFERHDRAMRAGEAAAREMSARLLQLALPEAQYAAYEQQRLAAPAPEDKPLPLVSLTIEPGRRINPKALEVETGLVLGMPITIEQAQRAGASLFGRGDLARVETDVVDQDGGRSVLIRPIEAEWARNRLRVGLELASDFSDNNSFALKVMHVRSSLNDWGAELRSFAEIGTKRRLGLQFWQPLGAGSQWYLAPSAEYGAYSVDLFDKGRRTARAGVNYNNVGLAFGRQLGNWGDLRFGASRLNGNVGVTVPDVGEAGHERVQQDVQSLSFNVDTLDSIAFPSRGTLVSLNWQRSSDANTSGAQALPKNEISLQTLKAFHTGRWAGHVYGEWSRSANGNAPNSLGGFLRLSGTAPLSIDGNSLMLGRVVFAREIGAMPAALGGVVRLGFSAEIGGGWGGEQPLRWSSMKQAGSAFVTVDTRFGPLYIGAGSTKGAGGTAYLFLGPIW